MLDSLSTLAAAQEARAASLPQHFAESPLRTALLERVRNRNTALDAAFYDVKVVSEAEAESIAPRLAAEGAILTVPPSGGGPLAICPSVEAFAEKHAAISTLAVAGVGSSALGSAAFARNVADATGEPVAAVVSGYGLADLAAEALGGFFWFGALNGVRNLFEGLDRATEVSFVWEPLPGQLTPLRESRDIRTVIALLEHPGLRFDTLVGHSKGNLVLSEALYAMRERDSALVARLAERTHVVTIGARIRMPGAFRRVTDVMGAWDWFGDLNSRRSIDADILMPGAWHHTNTELPAHLPVTAAMRRAMELP